MNINNLVRKSFVIGVITLLFIISMISSSGTSTNVFEKGDRNQPIPNLFGEKGENDWYISDVIIIFSYDPKLVDEIQYYLYGSWHVYTGQFVISTDDIYLIDWFWVDDLGEPHDGPPIELKLDQTPPNIELTKRKGLNDQVTFTATVNDPVSGVEKLEFYLDDELQETFTSGPYEWVWTGTTNHEVYAIAYNYAGLSEQSNILSTPRNVALRNSILSYLFQLFRYIFFTF